jgi:copper oxidase (laccase) domain-containing protein
VAIGPSIGSCCYEVDGPVIEAFMEHGSLFVNTVFTHKDNGKYMLDLWTANRLILESAGIPRENICVTDLCTCCNSQFFHSHRASGGNRGNLAAVIALK